MGQESSAKKDKEKKKAKEKQEKAQRKEERKANNNKGKSLEDMMAYVDENGNLSSTPPDPSKKIEINLEDIQIGAAKVEHEVEDTQRTGVITFFNDAKGFGFINDLKSQQSVFVHINQVSGGPLKERDRVTFETEMGPKGLNAIKVKKI